MYNHLPLTVAYEYSDWFQSLGGKDTKRKYKQERVVQHALGMAEAAFLLGLTGFPDINVCRIGAREAKQEFGALRKDAACRLIAAEYPDRFEFAEDKDSFLYDTWQEQPVSIHVSDAMVIAIVVARRLKRNALIAD